MTSTITSQFVTQALDGDFEKFRLDINDVDTSSHQHSSTGDSMLLSVAANGTIRRHTVGPGDVTHEQALGPANMVMNLNFKFDGAAAAINAMGPNQCNQIPLNLPMLQNQPLHTFTIKDQHLLKPPIVMNASKLLST